MLGALCIGCLFGTHELQELIKSYTTGTPPSIPSRVVDDGTPTVKASLKLGRSPPCQKFADLKTLAEIEECIGMLDNAASDGDIKSYVNPLCDQKIYTF